MNDALRPNSALTTGRASSIKTEHELAGGLEDWEDISGGDLDRYGFITVRKDSAYRSGAPEPRAPQRVSTVSILIANRTLPDVSPPHFDLFA